MARIRNIKPEFWRNEALSEVSPEAALLAIGLLNHADDEGYFHAHPKLVEADVFPLRDLSVNIHTLINELCDIGYIDVFVGTNGTKYGHVVNFLLHQQVNRPKASDIKQYVPKNKGFSTIHGAITDASLLEGEGEGEGEVEREVEVEVEGGMECIEQTSCSTPAFAILPTNKKGEVFPISQKMVDEWQVLYPKVDVCQQVRNMKGWSDANPRKRKTKSGMPAFVNRWLSREQDKVSNGGVNGRGKTGIEEWLEEHGEVLDA